MKALLRFLLMLILVSYLFVSFFYLRSYAGEEKCKGVQIAVLDSGMTHYFTPDDVNEYIDYYELNPAEKRIKEVDTERMEQALLKNGTLGSVECYKLVNGIVRVEVTQRTPIMRVLGDDGNYYVDRAGNRMAVCSQYRVNVPLVTGRIDSVLTYKDVLPLAQYIADNRFWNAQIEQIYINDHHEIELTPRVGQQVVLFGTIEDYENKLDNLMQVYTQVFSRKGWTTYDTISLKYKKQVVCSRRKS